MNILVTGGAGFIGSAVVRYLINHTDHKVVNIDKLTYAANPAALAEVAQNNRHHFVQADICDAAAMHKIFSQFRPSAVMHLAAESHVDNAIAGAAAFIETNITGTYQLLEVTRHYWQQLPAADRAAFRFLHVSTDEVYGDLETATAPAFTELSPYKPTNPYAASKAASDHLVRSWYRTYQLPVIITNCSNNYGPWQHKEKLIPKAITHALAGKPIPLYGDGGHIRDWMHVEDHASALFKVLCQGRVGESYNIGANCELSNISLVTQICNLLDQLQPLDYCHQTETRDSYCKLIEFTSDRPGHDKRYGINHNKIVTELGWVPTLSFSHGIRRTVLWHLQCSGNVKS